MAYGPMKHATELVVEEIPAGESPIEEQFENHEELIEVGDYEYEDSADYENWEDYYNDDSEDEIYQDYSLDADKYDKW